MTKKRKGLPWKKDGFDRIFDKDGQEVADVFGGHADFIVTACNNHFDLLANLKELSDKIDKASGAGICNADEHDAIEALIKKAEGQ